MNKKETHTISFRLDTHYLGALEARATKSTLSIHEEARRVLGDKLEEKDSFWGLEEI